MPFEKSAGAVVFHHGPDGKIEFLLLEHRAGHWNFPKGLIEKGEQLQETAMREVKEETGLKNLNLINGFKETIRYFFRVKYDYQVKERGFKMGQAVMKFVTYFLMESKEKDVKLSFEHVGFEWLEFDEAMARLKKLKNMQPVLKKAHLFLTKNDRI
jgi:8-oxo-dGTP pyrophosphatase MutT (NUDIX family)